MLRIFLIGPNNYIFNNTYFVVNIKLPHDNIIDKHIQTEKVYGLYLIQIFGIFIVIQKLCLNTALILFH